MRPTRGVLNFVPAAKYIVTLIAVAGKNAPEIPESFREKCGRTGFAILKKPNLLRRKGKHPRLLRGNLDARRPAIRRCR